MPNPKHYFRPNNPTEAAQRLRERHAYPLNGGGMALSGLDIPHETIVDVQDITALNTIYPMDTSIIIGGGVRLQSVLEEEAIPTAFHEALKRTISPNVLNNTSVMETLTIPNPPPEWIAVLAAYDVGITMMLTNGTEETFSFTETTFVAGEFIGRNLTDGLILNLTIPYMQKGEAIGTAHIARTPADEAIINTAVTVKTHPQDGKVLAAFAAMCGVSSEHTVELLSLGDLYNQPLTDETIERQAQQVQHVLQPPDDYRGSSAYRKAMATVLVRRALTAAASQLTP